MSAKPVPIASRHDNAVLIWVMVLVRFPCICAAVGNKRIGTMRMASAVTLPLAPDDDRTIVLPMPALRSNKPRLTLVNPSRC